MIDRARKDDLPFFIQKGLNEEYPAGTTGDWGDQDPFAKIGIEYAAFESTNWEKGNLDGYTQTDRKFGKKGEIWHTKYDTIAYIERTFPGRIKERLRDFQILLSLFIREYKFD